MDENTVPPVSETPQVSQPPKSAGDNHWITIASMALFVLMSLTIVGFLYYQNQQLKDMLAKYQTVQTSPSPSPIATTDPTANWKTYTDKVVGFKYPSIFIASPLSTQSGGYTQKFTNDKFTMSFKVIGNYNQQTGKPYATIDDYVGLPYQVRIITNDNFSGRQYLPRAGGESINEVAFLSQDKKSIYILNLETVDNSQNASLDEIKQGQDYFSQILSTFKFTSASPSASPSTTPVGSPSAAPVGY